MHDIIADLHGDSERLEGLLALAGYRRRGGVPRHPEGRKVLFLGDFIDRGRHNREVVAVARAMVEAGSAMAVMGNHELNAILYHTKREAVGGDVAASDTEAWLRPHNAKNHEQHLSFLDEFAPGTAATRSVLEWFLSLPLVKVFSHFRAVHAFWNDDEVARLRTRRPDGVLREEDLLEVADQSSDFGQAVDRLVKGPEVDLGDFSFVDHTGHRRNRARVAWWRREASTWREALASIPDPNAIPARIPATGLPFYPDHAPPVVFGHYKLGAPVRPHGGNTLCLDRPKAPCLYRMPADGRLESENLMVA